MNKIESREEWLASVGCANAFLEVMLNGFSNEEANPQAETAFFALGAALVHGTEHPGAMLGHENYSNNESYPKGRVYNKKETQPQ